ncbi:RHS repeat domain-containing protein [Pseudomonas putida]|uniref:RHS repeat-associated core domain-containing protein n=1 Tax=Pseudomonas putida TaxID=303 RepID=A0A6I6XNX9_PSEPU|nr:RHS repeat-associated core domain-containing protein [Pseudomonas putida]QHG63110.2 RHS repeat-associated core domain-containing protein [Pseudomonas putida]
MTDSRGLVVRNIACHRGGSGNSADLDIRINQQLFDARGHLSQQCDPRFFEGRKNDPQQAPNQVIHHGLSGRVLKSESIDAGVRIVFSNMGGQVLDHWDGRGTHQQIEYDQSKRLLAQFEQVAGEMDRRCTDRFTYAGGDAEEAKRNRCGQMIRHDDPAGSQWHERFNLQGQPSQETRQFLQALVPPDWPESVDARDELLEKKKDQNTQNIDVLYNSGWKHDALGAMIETLDAMGNVQRFEMDIAGRSSKSLLNDQGLLEAVEYNALGQVTMELAGNKVTTTTRFSAVNGRLVSFQASNADGKRLLHLQYTYDPVGNIDCVEDLAQPIKWGAGRVAAVSSYTYDTLYQLTSASGRENASQTIGPALPGVEIFGKLDDSRWRNYTQDFSYDRGGNLTDLMHKVNGAVVSHRVMAVDPRSNRSLFKESEGSPIDFGKGFDANGNQQTLAPGQAMQWDARNQLSLVTQVVREAPDGRDDDVEAYVYDGGGQRVRKVRRTKTMRGAQVSEVRYLPGLEIRTLASGEQLQVVTTQAGRSGVRLLHWEAGKPGGVDNDQLRYSVSDHLGSSMLELAQNAELISQESFYAYGGTAWWAARSAVEAKYKTVRYSGKERDATGLYYYGFRYYAPWLQRWINPDPAGDVDGLNLYRMTRNNPIVFRDPDGRMSIEEELGLYIGAAVLVISAIALVPLLHRRILAIMASEGRAALEADERATLQKLEETANTFAREERLPQEVAEKYFAFMRAEYLGRVRGRRIAFGVANIDGTLHAYSYIPSEVEKVKTVIGEGLEVSRRLRAMGAGHKVLMRLGSHTEQVERPQVSETIFEQGSNVTTQRKKAGKMAAALPGNQVLDKAGSAEAELIFTVENPQHFARQSMSSRDSKILDRTIASLRNRKIGYKLSGTNEYVVDLAGFGGQKGRGAFRLALTQEGTKRYLTRILNPHT